MIAALTVATIAEACGGQLIDHPLAATTAITGLAIDSRRIKSGDLFAALPGARADGHDFASVAMDQGAAALLVQRQVEIDCPQIVVDDCQRALADVARLARQPYGGVMLGVTGSAGKTTTKNLLHAVLSKAGRTLATEGNLNNELGVPLTLSRLDAGDRICGNRNGRRKARGYCGSTADGEARYQCVADGRARAY